MTGTRRKPDGLRLLQATTFVATLDRFVMPPMLFTIAVDLGVPLATTVQIAGVYFLAYGLLQPVWGVVADRLGRVATMRVTLALAGVAGVAAGLSWSPLALAAFRGVAGGLFGAAYPSALIYVGDTVSPQHRQRDIARLMVGVALGTGLASLLGGLLAAMGVWRVGFVLTGTAAMLLGLLLGRLPEPPAGVRATPTSALHQIGRSPGALLVLALAFVEGVVILGVLTLLPSALESTGAGAGLAGAVTAGYAASVLVGARLVGAVSLRRAAWVLVAIGGVAATAAPVLLMLDHGPMVGVVAAALLGLAWTFLHSSLQTWATEVLPAGRSMMVSLFAASLFVGSAVGPVSVSGPASQGRFGQAFAILAGLAVPLALVATIARARWRPPPAASPGSGAPVG